MDAEHLKAIKERAEQYRQCQGMAEFHNQENTRVRVANAFPKLDWNIFGSSSCQEHYAEDVPRLVREIEFLGEQLRDRESDLEFEYTSRIEAEQKVEDLEEELLQCQSELNFEQLRRNSEAR